jgi:SIR2-like domain
MADTTSPDLATATPPPAANLSEQNKRWDHLVSACLNGHLMPFLGAGMSYGAQLVGSDLPKLYNTGAMPPTQTLTKNMLSAIGKDPLLGRASDWSRAEEKRIRAQPHLSFADAAQLFIDLHPEGAVGLYANEGPLDIRLFTSLTPTSAHRNITWLVREGLFSEVISTNYDCALEKAYAESFGESFRPETDDLAGSNRSKFFAAVDNREAYRDHANKGHDLRWNDIPTTVLRLYKINGCSAAYHQAPNKKEARTLVITERHLQSFDLRKWAEDLFRDRFRCRTMVFSGFGAEEPQIRFTALRVMEEFDSSTDKITSDSPHCFLQEYNLALSASQLQIAKASIRPPATPPNPYQAVFSNVDTKKFWSDLYKSVLPELITRRLERSIVFAWLREHDDRRRPVSRAIAHSLRQKLFFQELHTRKVSPWLGGFLTGDETLLLMQLAWRVRQSGRTAPLPPTGYYEEFDRVESIPMTLLYIFHLLGVDADNVLLGSCNLGFWIQLPVANPDGTALFRWVLVMERASGRMPTLPPGGSRVATCLLLRRNGVEADKRRSSAAHSMSVTWRLIPLADLIAVASQTPPHTCDTEKFPAAHYRRVLIDGDFSAQRRPFYETPQAS